MTKDEDTRFRKAAFHWWERLQPNSPIGDSGALARLTTRSQESALEPATAELYRTIKPFLRETQEDAYETAALIAAVLAHVREDAAQSVARSAGHRARKPPA